jgi:hypothetical protein
MTLSLPIISAAIHMNAYFVICQLNEVDRTMGPLSLSSIHVACNKLNDNLISSLE